MIYENPEGVSVHNGFPNPATDTSLQSLDLNRLLIHNPASTFFMHIAGENWQALGIFHGDIAIIDRALAVRANDIVVWHCSGELTISFKADMPRNAIIWGVVSNIIHQYRKGGGHAQ